MFRIASSESGQSRIRWTTKFPVTTSGLESKTAQTLQALATVSLVDFFLLEFCPGQWPSDLLFLWHSTAKGSLKWTTMHTLCPTAWRGFMTTKNLFHFWLDSNTQRTTPEANVYPRGHMSPQNKKWKLTFSAYHLYLYKLLYRCNDDASSKCKFYLKVTVESLLIVISLL